MKQTRNYFIDYDQKLFDCEITCDSARAVPRTDQLGEYTGADFYKKGKLVDEYHRMADTEWVKRNHYRLGLKLQTKQSESHRRAKSEQINKAAALRKSIEQRISMIH